MNKLLFIFTLLTSCSTTHELLLSTGKENGTIKKSIKYFEIQNEAEVIEIDSTLKDNFGTIIIKYKYK